MSIEPGPILQWASAITAVVAAVSSIGFVVGYLNRKAIEPIQARWEAGAELIEAQLTPNGGSSLIDTVTDIKKEQERVRIELEKANAVLVLNHTQAEGHWSRLEDGQKQAVQTLGRHDSRLARVEAVVITAKEEVISAVNSANQEKEGGDTNV